MENVVVHILVVAHLRHVLLRFHQQTEIQTAVKVAAVVAQRNVVDNVHYRVVGFTSHIKTLADTVVKFFRLDRRSDIAAHFCR